MLLTSLARASIGSLFNGKVVTAGIIIYQFNWLAQSNHGRFGIEAGNRGVISVSPWASSLLGHITDPQLAQIMIIID